MAQAPDVPDVYEEYQAWPSEVTEAVARYFLSALRKSPRRCLVLGCATGVNDALPLGRLAAPGDRIVAGDVEPAFLKRLREQAASEGLSNVEPRDLDIRQDLAPLGRFDLVSLLFVIHRLKAWEDVVDRLCGLVAPGGSFFISEFVGPSGVIYLSNENGGAALDPVSRLIRRYFELLPEWFASPLRSTAIGPVLERLGRMLRPSGHQDFLWPQEITPSEMLQRIADRAYAPYFTVPAPPELLERLRDEFKAEAGHRSALQETIRIYRFEKVEA